MGQAMEISVIICAHDPGPRYLRRVLEALRAQTLPMEDWELLLVDTRPRSPLAAVWDLSWHPRARHVQEGELGIAAARRAGLRSAAADLIVFVDDDNVLAPDYLETGLAHQARQAGARRLGLGRHRPEFEMQPLPR